MKIGKHIGKRAKYKNKLGYFFETINHNTRKGIRQKVAILSGFAQD